MPRRFCTAPGCTAVFDAAGAGSYCPPCQAAADSRARARRARAAAGRPSAARRGYGRAYEKAREQLLATAELCHWCGMPPTLEDPLTADHDPPLSRGGDYRRLVAAHASCNFGRR